MSRPSGRWDCPALTWPQQTGFGRALEQNGISLASMPVHNMEKEASVSARAWARRWSPRTLPLVYFVAGEQHCACALLLACSTFAVCAM